VPSWPASRDGSEGKGLLILKKKKQKDFSSLGVGPAHAMAILPGLATGTA
jgi:hypothetical protein